MSSISCRMLRRFVLSSLVLGPVNCRAQGCQPYWASPSRPAGYLIDIGTLNAGDGPAIYACGFASSLTVTQNPVRRWNGHDWVPLGIGLAAQVGDYSFKIFDEGNGPQVHFTGAGPNHEAIIRRWTGTQWAKTTPGMYLYPYPNARPEFDVPTGSAAGLYGTLKDTSNSPPYVVCWQRGQWTRIGVAEVAPGEGGTIGWFHPMTVFDSGEGPELIVGGGFFTMNSLPMQFVARWNGHSWRAMGVGPQPPFAFCTYDDGTGPSLYMGYDGSSILSGVAREGVARWNGTDWVSVGGGTSWVSAPNGPGGVRAMAVFDDGSGPALFVTGTFDHAGGLPAKQIAKWDGHVWSALGAGIGGFPQNLAVANDGRGDSLFVQGGLSSAGGGSILDIAQWVGCRGQCYANCDNSIASPRLNVNDFMCFLDAFARREPYANCTVDANINAADFICFMNKFAAGCP